MQTLQKHPQSTVNCQHSLLPHRRPAAVCSFRSRSSRQRVDQKRCPCKCRNSAEDGSNGSGNSKNAREESGRIASTLAGLDLLLGVQPEKAEADKDSSKDASSESKVDVSISPKVLETLAKADVGRQAESNGKKDPKANKTVLFGLTLLSALQLGLLANISKLPKETVEWLSRPENYDPDLAPPGLEGFDPVPFALSALPITASVMATQLAHELGHRVSAARKKIKLGPSLFIPNSQIGTFGAVTQFKSLVKNNTDMFDVSFSGPAAALVTAVSLFVAGLVLSSGGDIPKESLVPVPTQLFQGSLLLGSIVNSVLGDEAMRSGNVLIHPVLIGGWCGLLATAFNSLPVGSLDGGKMFQAAYGPKPLGISGFFTYVGLGLGLLGSSLALPFGLYVLICQRASEKYVQDKITPASKGRQTALAVLIAVSVLILLPMLPSGTEQAAVSPGTFL